MQDHSRELECGNNFAQVKLGDGKSIFKRLPKVDQLNDWAVQALECETK